MHKQGLVGFGRFAVTVALLALTACSESKDQPAAVADAASADAASSDAASAESRVDAGPDDRELLLACEAEEPCMSSYAQMTEGGRRATIHSESTTCVLEGLEQRRPGRRYGHETNHTWTRGGESLFHLLMVRANGKVLYARTRFLQNRSDKEETPETTQLCTLRDPSYFAACAAAVRQVQPRQMIEDLPWECAFGEQKQETQLGELKWFESCEPAPATCE